MSLVYYICDYFSSVQWSLSGSKEQIVRALTLKSCLIQVLSEFHVLYNYAIEVWGYSVLSDTDNLNKRQLIIVRVIINCKPTDATRRHGNKIIMSLFHLGALSVRISLSF